jgi:16S rRNA C1402 (ribose-2'-O) methylase RsmI
MVEDIFGPSHEVYIGVELTKLHERHYRDTVSRVRAQIEEESEGSRFKGEVTIVIAPHESTDAENEKALRAGGFDPKRDAHIKVDLI